MSLWIIPVQATTDAFAQQVELDGVFFGVAFHWNARDLHWSVDVSKAGVVILAGLKLVSSSDLLSEYRRIADLPAGRLFIADLDARDRDPDDVLFGNRVVLQYEDLP